MNGQELAIQNQLLRLLNEGIYQVKISNEYGCAQTRTITVNGPCTAQIFAPTAFTPNSDNLNDIFKVIVIGGEGIKLEVYNRWGNEIYNEEGISPKWNGIYKGEVSPSGVYPYIFTYKLVKDNTPHTYSGTVLILGR